MINKTAELFIFLTLIANPIFAQQVDTPKLSDTKTKSEALTDEIGSADSSLFNAFNNCDIATYRKYFNDDLEFYHDLGGLTVSLQSELQSFREMCARGTHLRRELVKSSLEVYPIKNYGAIEIGIHRFFHTNEGEKEKPSGTYKFIHIWRKRNGEWKISRVISYGHGDMKND